MRRSCADRRAGIRRERRGHNRWRRGGLNMPSKVLLSGQLMFPTDYLAAVEFKGKDVTLTIAAVAIEELKMKGGVKERKPVVSFEETKKKLVLNKTNADSIAEMY